MFATDLPDADIAYLEALYRGRGRAERQICDTKATGLTNLPSHSFAINTAWLQLALTAHDLLAWSRLLLLDGDMAPAEPKRLRYCLFHTAGHLVTTGRRRTCRLSATCVLPLTSREGPSDSLCNRTWWWLLFESF